MLYLLGTLYFLILEVLFIINLYLTFNNITLVELVLVEMCFDPVGILSSCLLVELSFGQLVIWLS
jgi:hypothetical protein